MIVPCKGCNRRSLGCHADCNQYKAFVVENERRRTYERRFSYEDAMPQTQGWIREMQRARRKGNRWNR